MNQKWKLLPLIITKQMNHLVGHPGRPAQQFLEIKRERFLQLKPYQRVQEPMNRTLIFILAIADPEPSVKAPNTMVIQRLTGTSPQKF